MSEDAAGDAATLPESGGVGSDAGETPPPLADAGLTTLSIDPPLPRVEQGVAIDVKVSIVRTASLTGDVAVELAGLPTGVTTTSTIIPAGSSETTFKLSSTPSTPMGITAITLKAEGATDLPARLAVAGPPGALDTSFDSDGILLDTSSATAVAYAVAELPDGQLIVAGTTGSGWFVRRYDESGKPDAAFNTNAASALPTTGIARTIAIDSATGRILVGGGSVPASTEAATIVRLNPDGSADQNFANAGTFIASSVTHPNGSRVNAMVVTADSRIVVAGASISPVRAFFERYTSTGASDDLNFAHYADQNTSTFTALLPLPSGAYLATGADTSVSPPVPLAMRFVSTGSPDTTFNSTGRKSYTDVTCSGAAAALSDNGDAMIVGQDVTGPSYCETRIAASGSGNKLFSKTIAGGNSERFNAAAAGPANTVYAAGQGGGSQDRSAIVLRRTADGSLDPTFAPTASTPGLLSFADPSTPDGYFYNFQALSAARAGRLYIGGSRAKSSTGFIVFRIWE